YRNDITAADNNCGYFYQIKSLSARWFGLIVEKWKDNLIFIGVLSVGLAAFILSLAYFGQ
ncbi:hypothetical protein, partial [Bacillus licheniformis]|uniref:hypothetical protein n=1 Tax=Bacillus licheniformis TaxID=1402 RepID=UPI0019562DE5